MKTLVVVFEDELRDEEIDFLFEDLDETEIMYLHSFDDGCKIVVSVPDEIPKESDFEGSLEEYWSAVIDDSLKPCCLPKGQQGIGVYAVKTIEQFIQDDKDLNDGEGNYTEELEYFV